MLLGAATLVEFSRLGSFAVSAFFALIGFAYASSILALVGLRFVKRWPWLLDGQPLADVIMVSAFIFVTGGIASYFPVLYVLPIIAASTLGSRRGSMQAAGLSAVLYLAMVTIQYTPVMDRIPDTWYVIAAVPGTRVAILTLSTNLFGFVAVGWLSGSLADGLRKADVRLEYASLEIADLRAFNEHVIDSLLSGLATADDFGRVLTFNRTASTITGVTAHKAIDHHLADVLQLAPGDRKKLGEVRDADRLRVDSLYHRSDGSAIELGLTASRIALPDGRQGFLVTFQDVTDLRRLERNARLQQRLAAVGEMAAGIAHEIRNPLASMSGSLQVLRQELPLSREQTQLMDIVFRESERLNDTIRSFLAYARPQQSTVSQHDVGGLVNDTALLLRHGSSVHEGHVVTVNVPPAPVWFDADEHQLRQIVWNLATNGLRAMPDGGTLTLAVHEDVAGGERDDVLITVRDTGCGIPSDELETIFQPFRSSFERGTGLGLAIVHRTVADYGGDIQVT